MKVIKRCVVFLCLFSLAWHAPHAYGDIKVGVTAAYSFQQAMDDWGALGAYLHTALQESVSILPLGEGGFTDEVVRQGVDFFITDPVKLVMLQKSAGAMPLASVQTKQGGMYGGVIVALKQSGIRTSEDLKGKKVMALKFGESSGAYLFQTYHLQQRGLNPHKDFSKFDQGRNAYNLVRAVANGMIDAAFVRTGVLEAMAREGTIQLNNFLAVDHNQPDNFAHLLTTELYPEWYVGSMPKANSVLVRRLKNALMKIPATAEVLKTTHITGFSEPLPTEKTQKLLRVLKIYPYAAEDGSGGVATTKKSVSGVESVTLSPRN